MLKWRQIEVHIEREAVVGGPCLDGDADGGDFSTLNPNAGLSLSPV